MDTTKGEWERISYQAVTAHLGWRIRECKAGKVVYRIDRNGNWWEYKGAGGAYSRRRIPNAW